MSDSAGLVGLARNPVPAGSIPGQFEGYDGAPLRYARWEPTRGPARGTVCVFPGRSEFIEKYFEVVADLRRRGFAVAIMDWRGQGGSHRALSNPRKGHIRDFSEYDRDLNIFMLTVVRSSCPGPYIALAHSMGGNILLRHAASKVPMFDRMVLSAPMLAFARERMPLPERLVRAHAVTANLLGFGRMYVPGGHDAPVEAMPFDDNPLTTDRGRFDRNAAIAEAAPHLTLGSPTNSWLWAAFRSMDRISRPQFARDIAVPLLIMAAGADTIVSTRVTEEFANRLKIGSAVIIARARHELMQESDDNRQQFWAAFDAYLGVDEAVG